MYCIEDVVCVVAADAAIDTRKYRKGEGACIDCIGTDLALPGRYHLSTEFLPGKT